MHDTRVQLTPEKLQLVILFSRLCCVAREEVYERWGIPRDEMHRVWELSLAKLSLFY